MPDFTVFDRGTVVGFIANNEEAEQWFAENVDTFQTLGVTGWADHRVAQTLVEAIEGLGFTVEKG
jgi:hypothetical protein